MTKEECLNKLRNLKGIQECIEGQINAVGYMALTGAIENYEQLINEHFEPVELLKKHDLEKEEKKMKFKVGDKVRIRKDVTATEWYGSELFVPFMEKYKGKILTIVKVNPNNKKYKCDDCEDWVFTDEMLEPVNETVDHPSHYNQGKREVIEEMRILFGDEAVESFCRLNAYKYMRRAEFKGNKKEDLDKADWYMDYLEMMRGEE